MLSVSVMQWNLIGIPWYPLEETSCTANTGMQKVNSTFKGVASC